MGEQAMREGSTAAAASQSSPPVAPCLTSGQLQALQRLPPGQMPAEVAEHLASCERCQRLALFGAAGSTARRPKETPSLGKALLRVVVVLVALGMVLVSMRILLG